MYFVDDLSFWRLPEDEQHLIIPFVMRTTRMAVLVEFNDGPSHPEEDVTGASAEFREGDRVDSCLTYTTRYFSLQVARYPDSESFQEPQINHRTRREVALGLINQSLFVGGRVT